MTNMNQDQMDLSMMQSMANSGTYNMIIVDSTMAPVAALVKASMMKMSAPNES